MLISVEYYTQLIEELGFLKGKNRELEKQLEKLERPEEIIALDPIKEYEQAIINQLNKDCEIGDLALEKARTRIDENIEGIETAIRLIEKV